MIIKKKNHNNIPRVLIFCNLIKKAYIQERTKAAHAVKNPLSLIEALKKSGMN